MDSLQATYRPGPGHWISSGPPRTTGAPQVTAGRQRLLPTWLVGWKGGPAGAGMACRVRRACEAWSASVREIYRGNAKQRELRGVAYNGSDGSRVWAYYKTVYMA